MQRSNNKRPTNAHQSKGFSLQHVSKHTTTLGSLLKFEAVSSSEPDALVEPENNAVLINVRNGVTHKSVAADRTLNKTV